MRVGEVAKRCSICGLELRPETERCPRCGNVLKQRHDED